MSISRYLTGAVAILACFAAAPASAGVQYTYDSAGRLVKAVYSNGITIEYRYDAAGNRTQIVTTNTPNSQPIAGNDTGAVAASGSVNILVRSNDSDPDGNSLTVSQVTTPVGGGSVSIQGSGTYVRYTAPATTGTKTFNYTISDGAGGTASATVTIQVSAANQAPVAVDDEGDATINTSQALFVLGNDTDPNGDALTVTGVSSISGGSVTIEGTGAHVIFQAPATAGSYTFNYTVSDGAGGSDVGAVVVDVTLGEQPCIPNGPEQCEIDP